MQEPIEPGWAEDWSGTIVPKRYENCAPDCDYRFHGYHVSTCGESKEVHREEWIRRRRLEKERNR